MEKPSLVVVSPLPPAWTGVARYTAHLLQHLAKSWRLSVVVGDGEPVDRDLLPDDQIDVVHSSSWRWFEPIARHDRILHCLGNSEFHRHVPPLVAAHGGVVLAHEVRMNALQCLRALQVRDPHWLSAMLQERHGVHLGDEIKALEAHGGITGRFHEIRSRLDAANTYLLEPAVRGAHAVAVHSQYAASLAALDLRGTTPVHVLPFGHQVRPECDRSTSDASGTISTFGFVAPEKHADLLLEAFAILAADHQDLRLRYAGHVHGPFRDHLLQRARRLGVEARVGFTGRLTEDGYADELHRATIAVQLRSTANGEASAAIADCLSAGVPTLVSRLGAQAELPAEAVEMVDPRAGARDVAAAMSGLLDDPRRRAAMSLAARRFAQDRSFAHAAEALSDLLLTSPATR